MNGMTHRNAGMLLAATLLTLSTDVQAQPKQEGPTPRIEGTYKLVSRHMADGTIVKAPDVMGMVTYTKDHRNFNVIWKDAAGKFFSYSLVSTYKLSATEYTETILFSIMNDQIGGKEIAYDLSGPTKKEPVSVKDGKITFKLPFDPVTGTFETDKFEATGAGFTDYWEKVK